jgi:hypothetical protein
MNRRLLSATFALLLAGCADNNPVQNPMGGSAEWDLYEPVVRQVLPRAEAAAAGKRPVVYVELPDGAPAAEFCRRFDKERVGVRPLSGAPKEVPGEAAYILRFSSVSGDNVQWEGQDQGRVFVLDYPASSMPTCGTPYPFRLRRNGERWVVVSD